MIDRTPWLTPIKRRERLSGQSLDEKLTKTIALIRGSRVYREHMAKQSERLRVKLMGGRHFANYSDRGGRKLS